MAKEGDIVRITTVGRIYEGLLMPRPKLLSQDITVLKLSSGYNIGIENKRIKKIELVKTYKPVKKPSPKLKPRKGLPTIAVLSTGGTISSRIDYITGAVMADYTAEDFVAMCPELQEIANIKARSIMSKMSEDLLPADWLKMAKEVIKELPNVDGIVITHGTDTLHFTTAALSFLLKDLCKPVVVTGAQRSIDRGSSDAFMNLICAVTAAAKWPGAEVVSCLHGSINDDYCNLIRGTKLRKMHTSRRDAFRAINDEPLARVYLDGKIEITNQAFRKACKAKTNLARLEPRVALVYAHPVADPGIIDYHLKKGIKGLVVAGTALGHVPTSNPKSFIPGLKKAVKAGIPVVITSQTLYGRVHPFVYSNLRRLSMETGCIFAADMLPEVAYIKLMAVLARTSRHEEVHKLMLENFAGELTTRELDDSFLR